MFPMSLPKEFGHPDKAERTAQIVPISLNGPPLLRISTLLNGSGHRGPFFRQTYGCGGSYLHPKQCVKTVAFVVLGSFCFKLLGSRQTIKSLLLWLLYLIQSRMVAVNQKLLDTIKVTTRLHRPRARNVSNNVHGHAKSPYA